jgi:hypothetical protein
MPIFSGYSLAPLLIGSIPGGALLVAGSKILGWRRPVFL